MWSLHFLPKWHSSHYQRWGKTAGQQSGQGLCSRSPVPWKPLQKCKRGCLYKMHPCSVALPQVLWEVPAVSQTPPRVRGRLDPVRPTQPSLESVPGADGRAGWLPGCGQITWRNLGKRDAVSLFTRNAKYAQAWILDESAPAKWFRAGKPCEGSQRFSSRWTRCCSSKILLASSQVWHLEFSRRIDQVSWWTLVLCF